MWNKGWRDGIWSCLNQPWDLVIVGGGITGAGILREAARSGLKVLLLEANDFGSGTSSRSSKLVHGGFRYLKNAQIRLTMQSVRERERLLREGRGLVNQLGFLLANYDGDAIPGRVFGAGLIIYDLLALKWGHRHYDAYDMHDLCPALTEAGLQGGYRYFDAQTDDARLVLRVIQEAVMDGGMALNYTLVTSLLTTRDGRVCGVRIQDQSPEGAGRSAEINACVVVNATGAWADILRQQIGGKEQLRKLCGSHLIFPFERLPLTRSVSFLHPDDGRPVFALPWEGVTLLGTTDVDLQVPLKKDTAISSHEIEYLMQAAQFAFGNQTLTVDDIQATYSGVRPVIDTGNSDPSKESREHILWNENGLLTVTGGKLTTFRLMAHDALNKVRALLPGHPKLDPNKRVLAAAPMETVIPCDLTPAARLRLIGRYGLNLPGFCNSIRPGELTPIAASNSTWAELRWAARAEGAVHLDDLLLRRVRLGLLLPRGGLDQLDQIKSVVQPELGWDDERWESEARNYSELWKKFYYLGEGSRTGQPAA